MAMVRAVVVGAKSCVEVLHEWIKRHRTVAVIRDAATVNTDSEVAGKKVERGGKDCRARRLRCGQLVVRRCPL